MATLFWSFVLLFVVCIAIVAAVDRVVRDDYAGDRAERLFSVGFWAASAAPVFAGAAIGAGWAWGIS